MAEHNKPAEEYAPTTAGEVEQGGRTKMKRRSSLNRAQCTDVGDTAQEYVRAFSRRSSFRDLEKEQTVHQFRMEDIAVGRLLGTGSFNDVYEATVRRSKDQRRRSSDAFDRDGARSDDEIIRETAAAFDEKRIYALKYLRPVVMDDPDAFATAAVDLAIEAKMLSSLDHPNVIKLHGVTAGSIRDAFSSGIEGGYFLVLDRVECTLGDRVRAWANEQGKLGGGGEGGSARQARRRSLSKRVSDSLSISKSGGMASSSSTKSLQHRLLLATGVARGLQYLHTKNIVYRDTKPDNIGIDAEGEIKIFDFGLATEIVDRDKKLTGMVGTRRYMAPEVAKYEQYDTSSDVYSFALLLWEMVALDKPFAKMNAKQLSNEVIYGNHRPKLSRSWPEPLKCLLEECWSADRFARPTMRDAADRLEAMTGVEQCAAAALKKTAFPVRKVQRRRSLYM